MQQITLNCTPKMLEMPNFMLFIVCFTKILKGWRKDLCSWKVGNEFEKGGGDSRKAVKTKAGQ